jgi:hypothetical protein
MVVVSVNYRLYESILSTCLLLGTTLIQESAPEHPYPAALNDAWATLEWVLNKWTILWFLTLICLFEPGSRQSSYTQGQRQQDPCWRYKCRCKLGIF